MVGVLSDTSVGVTNACFRSGDALVLGGGAVGNTQNRGGCATRATSTVHNQEWLCHNVAELGAVVVVLGGECFEFGMCTARSRCATTALLLGIEVCDCCAETIRAAVHRRERRCYADRASALRAFTRPSEKLGEPRCNSDTWGSHERSTNMRRHEDWILVGVTAVFRQ